MANSGAFKLITNDGKQDDMLMATRFLNERLYEIEKYKSQSPRFKDPSPTLSDIEKTHVLFVNAHFKPYVAIGYEYQVVNSQGAASLGNEVVFSLPQYGDFFSDMFLHIELDEISAKATTDANQYVRYVNYPGVRMMKKVQFEVNGNPLDDYDSDIFAFHREFCVQPNKEVGFARAVGQEVAFDAKVQSSAGRGAGYSTTTTVLNGAQTPKATQPKLEMNIPLIFWFNKDFAQSIPSVAIPFGQRYIRIQLAGVNELIQHVGTTPADDAPGSNQFAATDLKILKCELFVNNIFVNPEIHEIFIKRIGFNLIRVHRVQKTSVDKSSENILLNSFKWPIETIYTGIRPDDNNSILNKKMLDGWDQFHQQTESTAKVGSIEANAWYWDLTVVADGSITADEYTAGLLRVDGRASGINFATALGVGGATVLTVTQINSVLKDNGLRQLDGTFADEAGPTIAELDAALPDANTEAKWLTCEKTVDTLAVRAQAVELYKTYHASMFNDYIPFRYGGYNIRTPKDCGKYMIPFNLHPGLYQPSGHVNVSRAREFYVEYTSSIISTSTKGTMVFIGIALNFLLISDGSAVLRYAT